MRLIELSSSRRTFKTVRFNPTGLSLVVGRHTQRQSKNIQSTYNGVGKSLLIALLHFCLGSNKNKHFEAHLQDWDFTLTFNHAGKQHQVTRTVGEAALRFDGTELTLAKYKDALGEMGVFDLPADANGLSFRSLISYFLRPSRASYNTPEGAIPQWTPYLQLLNESFLLGLDYERAREKHDAKKLLDDRLEQANKYKKDKELRDFYLGEKNAEVELASLREQARRLETNLAAFAVAEDYGERQGMANALHARIQNARNEEVVLTIRLSDIDLAMNIKPDVTPDRLTELYRESEIDLPEMVTKRLDEVNRFHERLWDNRLRRLAQEKKSASAELESWERKRLGWQSELDGLLQYLKAHRALDEYTENNRYLAEVTARVRKIEDYLLLLSKYTDEAQRIRAEMGKATVQTTEYLKEAKSHLDLLMDMFRGYSREFYGDKAAGLVVRNNDKDENQLRYDIEVRIENDAADGINDVRIFCFDLLLLALQRRHNVEFLFHDSRLFADMDWHQRLTLFRLADRVCRERGFQYIATINEDHVESLREPAKNDFDRLFVESRILELTDKPDGTGKLLGVQLEMKYESE